MQNQPLRLGKGGWKRTWEGEERGMSRLWMPNACHGAKWRLMYASGPRTPHPRETKEKKK